MITAAQSGMITLPNGMTVTSNQCDWWLGVHICRWCGYSAVRVLGDGGTGLNITYGLNDHYYASPDCWNAEQQRLWQRYREERGSGARQAWTYSVEKMVCADCERPVYYWGNRRRPWRCAYCVGERIQRYRQSQRKPTTFAECEVCGRHYTQKRSDAVYCSPKCRQRAYRRRVTDNRQTHNVTGE